MSRKTNPETFANAAPNTFFVSTSAPDRDGDTVMRLSVTPNIDDEKWSVAVSRVDRGRVANRWDGQFMHRTDRGEWERSCRSNPRILLAGAYVRDLGEFMQGGGE